MFRVGGNTQNPFRAFVNVFQIVVSHFDRTVIARPKAVAISCFTVSTTIRLKEIVLLHFLLLLACCIRYVVPGDCHGPYGASQ